MGLSGRDLRWFGGVVAVVVIVTLSLSVVNCDTVSAASGKDTLVADSSSNGGSSGSDGGRMGRSSSSSSSKSSYVTTLLACAARFDGACLLDRAEEYMVQKHHSLIEEADEYALQHHSRQTSTEEESTPSELIDSISHIFMEIRNLFKGGITGLFRDGKEDDGDAEEDDDDAEEEEEDDEETKVTNGKTKKATKNSRGLEQEERGKKKKKKLKAIIKLLVLGAVFVAKITLLLKVLAAHLQIKFLLIAFAGLIINAARFYFDLKKGHSPQKVIYYEHAQHQHHYDGGDEDWSGAGGGGSSHGGYWGRSYLVGDENKSAQDVAYAKQKPVGTQYARVEDKPNFSWE